MKHRVQCSLSAKRQYCHCRGGTTQTLSTKPRAQPTPPSLGRPACVLPCEGWPSHPVRVPASQQAEELTPPPLLCPRGCRWSFFKSTGGGENTVSPITRNTTSFCHDLHKVVLNYSVASRTHSRELANSHYRPVTWVLVKALCDGTGFTSGF